MNKARYYAGRTVFYALGGPVFLGLFGFIWMVSGLITGEFSLRKWWASLE